MAQLYEQQIEIDHIITPSGSGGTHGGLVIGFFAMRSRIPILGINIRRSKEEQEERIQDVINRTVALLDLPLEIPKEAISCSDEYYQPGYMLPNPGMIEAVRLLAQTEGILLDPGYSGKAMAGLIDLVRNGYFKKEENILFIHTGGAPALYAYLDTFLDERN